MRSIDKITLEEHFTFLYDAYANFVPERLNCMQTMKNYMNSYKLMYGIPIGINARKILELGIGFNGLSSYIFLEALKVTGGHLTSVEINPNYNYDRFPYYDKNKWTILHGDDLNIEGNDLFDIIMIDTSHEREQTTKELYKFVPMLRNGGYLYIHDTNEAGVKEPLDEYMISNPNILEIFYTEDTIPQMTILRKL